MNVISYQKKDQSCKILIIILIRCNAGDQSACAYLIVIRHCKSTRQRFHFLALFGWNGIPRPCFFRNRQRWTRSRNTDFLRLMSKEADFAITCLMVSAQSSAVPRAPLSLRQVSQHHSNNMPCGMQPVLKRVVRVWTTITSRTIFSLEYMTPVTTTASIAMYALPSSYLDMQWPCTSLLLGHDV